MRIKFTALFALLIIAVLASACGSALADDSKVTSVLTEAEATAIAENALNALNSGDYTAWSRDWDDSMKSAINEKAFLQYREQALAQAGRFQSIPRLKWAPASKPIRCAGSLPANSKTPKSALSWRSQRTANWQTLS